MQDQRDKGRDKPVADPHREYLDEEFSDDEDAQERKRRAQADEFDGNLLRASYRAKELDKLVTTMKEFTVLSRLDAGDWTEQCISTMKEFFEYVANPVITFFFLDNTLTARLAFPNEPLDELAYFARAPYEIFTPEDFHSKVTFGTINDNVEVTILTLINNVLAPSFSKVTAWPDSVKEDFCLNVQNFLCNLTDLRYKMLGLTVIYQPREGRELTADEAAADKDLVKRLEGVVVHWTRQIRIALGDQDQSTATDLLTFRDEYDFWIYRYDNLRGLTRQLQTEDSRRLLDTLKAAHSTHLRQLQGLIDEIDSKILEAESNVEFMSILLGPCAALDTCNDPNKLKHYLPEIIQLCRVIWKNSPYLGNEQRMTRLFEVIGNQVIAACTRAINVDEIFAGKTRKAMKTLHENIAACQHYKDLYKKIAAAHNKLTDQKWDLRIDQVFRYVDVFVVRCHNLIEILQAMIDFARMDETQELPEVEFSGTKGSEYELFCCKLQTRFLHLVAWLRRNSSKILDIRQSTWYDDMAHFRSEIRKLEVALEILMEDVFKEAGNLDESVRALHAFRYYVSRENLKKSFDIKTSDIWQGMREEVEATKQEMVSEIAEYPVFCPHYSGRALNLRVKANRLKRLSELGRQLALQHVGGAADDESQSEIFNQCAALTESIETRVADLFRTWLTGLGDNPQSRLDRNLMRWATVDKSSREQRLECNVDPRLLSLCGESNYWTDLRFELPNTIQAIIGRWKSLQFVYENILAIVGAYNKIVQALSSEEKSLFRELIKQVETGIKPGLTMLTWRSEYIEDYISECNKHSGNLQEFLDTYKKSNLEIFKICENICAISMIKIKHNYAYEMEELLEEMEQIRMEAAQLYVNNVKQITQLLNTVYQGFQAVIENCMTEWKIYLLNFDRILEESFKLSIKNSLSTLYEALHGDGTTAPTPLLQLTADLVDNKINFSPTLTDVAHIVSAVFEKLLDCIRMIPRVVENFDLEDSSTKPFWKVYAEDEDLDRSRQMLNNEVSYCFTQVQNYMTTWEPFRDIWETKKDLFIQRYEKLKPTVALFDADIARYGAVANNVQMQETVVTVYFLEVNADRLKAAIIEQCSQWQQRLTDLLLKMTEAKVHHVYKYVADNGKKISREPKDLNTMQAALLLFERLTNEIPKEESEFEKIRQQYETLEKYEVPMTLDLKRKVRDLDECWAAYLDLMETCNVILQNKKEEFKNKLVKEDGLLRNHIAEMLRKFYDEAPFSSDWKTKTARQWLSNFRKKVNHTKDKLFKLKKDLTIFSISLPDSQELNTLLKDLSTIELVWELTKQWDRAWERYKTGNFWSIQMTEMEETANVLFRKLTRLSRELKERNWSIVDASRLRVDKFRRTLPLIIDLKNPSMRDRHWKRVMRTIGVEFDQNSKAFTLDAIADMQMHDYVEEIADISNAATMELAIETGLKNISDIWKTMPIEMVPYKDEGIYRLKAVDDIIEALEENQMQLSGMKSTKFVEPFALEVDYWERALSTVGEILEMVLNVQKMYLYLDNIFAADDIRKQLPEETREFLNLSAAWKEITSRMAASGLALEATHTPPGLLDTLNKLINKLETIQRELEAYLETKRHVFPRFYFISNDDLLEILANSKKPEMIQPHIKKLFEGIKTIKLGKSASGKSVSEGMSSAEGEYVEFLQPVLLEGQVERWLCNLEAAMRNSLREVLRQCRAALRKMSANRDKWVKEWQSQPGITATQIQWTTDCTRILLQCKLSESKKPLKKLKRKQNQALAKYTEAVRGDLDKLQRLKLKAIVVIEIHARDVIDKMYKSNTRDVSAFEWLSQLRFYWDRDIDDCIVRQTNTSFIYGYEYLGNSERLVITPLTDRCYITLTTALHLHRGGSPKGPAGTGKTETVKDLGKALGFNVIVVNCSEGLDYKSMGRMFSGLAQTGAWGCFDEFNRIYIEVLSVVAQQILSIISALTQKLTRFVFEGTEIGLVHTVGFFITMNPGYAGRTELPDNLKSMFRPISMMVPDSGMIAEINLFGEGFDNSRSLARKIFTLYSLAQQQLSKQCHYDFGLRGIVTLCRYAGKKRRSYPNLPDEEVVILAMNDMNIAKLTTDDLPLFVGITSDLFPGVQVPTVDYTEFLVYVTNEAMKLKLQAVPALITKVIELYETKNSRHSAMIVGQSNTGKSATWRCLQNTLTQMAKDKKPGFNIVKDYPLNPKALNLGELYGEYNLATGEWSDGVISSVMRKTCADESPHEKWIVFDGPVDAVWIENMNSVMDDNKILTLINNDRITLPDQVSLLFEVENLDVASPATVSRAGMVYNDYKDLGWRPYVNSWLQKYESKPEFIEEMNTHFDTYVNKTVYFKRHNCNELVPVPEPNAVQSLCKLLEVLATPQNGVELGDNRDAFNTMCKLWFLFCMIWSICASVDERGRKKLDAFVRELEGSAFPMRDSIYEYYVDVRQRIFVSWEEKLSPNWKFHKGTPFYKIVVPTVDTARYNFLVNVLLTNGFPVLLIGPVGTGKTSTAQSVLGSLDRLKFSNLIINMSGQTTSKNVQDAIESKVEKRTKGVFLPIGGKTMITFMDDFNMPMKETYGSQPPLELIRQWMGYGFWYDRQNQSRKYIQKMLLMASMGPPGGGRNTITERLLSKFNVINMTFPAEKQIVRIYGTMLNQQLLDFHQEVKGLANDITKATMEMYSSVVDNMLPTPMKMHYLFNLRDISKIFQGLLRSHKDYQYSKQTFLRLWIHETFRVFNDRLIDDQDREWFISELNAKLGEIFDTSFSSICPEKRCPVFGAFMNVWNIYEDMTDIAAVRTFMESQMDEYNSSTGVVRLDLILFRDAVEHICRIVRITSEPRGNMLLVGIGGSGRQSLSRLAAYMCELTTFQIEVSKLYGVPEFREDLKLLYMMAGVENKPTSFLFNDTQIVEEAFLEIVNNMLSTGEVASLFKSDELEDIKNKLAKDVSRAGISPTTEASYRFLIQRVRANLHVILCMSPIGEAFRNRLRQYPALINCTTIDWFHEWPTEALLEVGNKFLMNLDFTLTITGERRSESAPAEEGMPLAQLQDQLRTGIAATFALIHSTVSQYSRRMVAEMKRYNYVTPTNFLELVAGYKEMLGAKRDELSGQANKLRNGLFKLDDTKEKVNEMAIELVATQQQVQSSTVECEEFLVSIVSQRRDADETQKVVTARSLKIAEESKVCKQLEMVAREDLASVEPALEEAMRALDALSKKDISEIKSFTRPPAKVEMVMEAVMILKNSEPTWAESKRQLGDVNFLSSLRDFDKDHITDKTLRTIGKYTSNPDFEPEKVGQVSTAAKSLCMWVIAMEQYGKLFRIVAPKRAKLKEALDSLAEKENALAEATAQLQKLQEELKRLQQMYDAKMKEKEDLINLEELLMLKLDRAAMLVDGLSGERVRWEVSVQELNGMFDLLPGDCLIGTAFVSYLGPFVSNYREELVRMWALEVTRKEIPGTRRLDVKSFLSDPTSIREWNIQGLPSDDFSTENGIIITRGSRWPLVIDPQGQAAKWIRNMEAKNGLKIIDFGQSNFTTLVEKAIQFGKPVLLQNVGETLEPVMDSVLQKAFIKSGDQVMIKFNDKMITFNDKFRLFITTKLPNPHYAPEISTKTTLCNFAIKEQGLEDQLLGIVVRKEKPQLEEQKDNLVLTIATGKRTLKELENKILYLLSVSSGSLLDDLDLLTTLQTSKSTAITIQESLVVSEKTEKEIDSAREAYRPCSKRAALLFFVLNDMSLIDPMYQFSLDAYISLFNISIDKSPKSEELLERNDALNDYHTYALYRNTCRGLFEQHKLLFSFHMCIKIMTAQDKINRAEYAFLLTGGIVLDRDNQATKPVTWLTDEQWDNITELDKFPGFHGLVMTFEQSPRDWLAWYLSNEPEEESLVSEWEDQCNEFQKILIIRCCRMDRITNCLRNFIVHNLGQAFVEPPVLDVKEVFEDSTKETPLIFVLSPGVDPTAALMLLAENSDMGSRFMSLSLGQGQAPIATRMIEVGSKEGAWVFLANCHLSLSWMPALDKIVETMAGSKLVHPDFRLWLSSSPTPQFPISILQAGIKMTTEPPKGLKANMKRLYGLITDAQFDLCTAKSKYKKLLFSLVFFHSILLERKKFQQLGWNVVYSFNDSDFEVSENLLQVYLDEYPNTPWDALKYLIAGICYGGHVTDDWDRRLLLAYVEDYITEAVLSVPQYRLSSLPTYYIPRDGSLETYRDFINVLPMTDRPEAFGQHANADITSQIMEVRMTFETLLSLQVQASSAGGEAEDSPEDRAIRLAQDIVAKMPSQIDLESTERMMLTNKTPLDVVLLQEIFRYNELLGLVRANLEDLCRAIRGLVVMSAELEDTYTCVLEGRVPAAWSRAYPSLKPLGAWTRDLSLRIEFFARWAETTQPPALFWLAAFTFPTGFLTAVLQTSARRTSISIDALTWEFAVAKGEESAITVPPKEGVYIRSMFLEGAGWNKKTGALMDPAPMQLIYDMPVIQFKPTESIRKRTKGLYNCPCYYYPQRQGIQGRPAYVVTVDLNSGPESAAFWTKRGAALLLSLSS